LHLAILTEITAPLIRLEAPHEVVDRFVVAGAIGLGLHPPPFMDPRVAVNPLDEAPHVLVWRQEYLAEFTSLDAAALIDVTKLLQPDGEPWPEPERLDLVFVS
jgi:hypothetical protein